MKAKKTRIPSFVLISMIIDVLLLAGLLFFQPPVSTVMIFAMLVVGVLGIRRLARWIQERS